MFYEMFHAFAAHLTAKRCFALFPFQAFYFCQTFIRLCDAVNEIFVNNFKSKYVIKRLNENMSLICYIQKSLEGPVRSLSAM